MKTSKRILALTLISLSIACGKKALTEEESGGSVDPVEASLESGLTMVSGMADDQAGSSFAAQSSPQKLNIWESLLGSRAYADACLRAVTAPCVSGVKSVDYNSCEVSGTNKIRTGEVTLTYSHMSCTLTTDGDSVTRTYDITISGPRGGVVTHSSNLASDYRGTSYSGGGQIVKTASGWQASILGRHTTFSFRNREIFNVSTRTLAPLSITGSLNRASRNVDGGQIEINHNRAQFTSVISPHNLQWSGSCCHPVSGSLDVVYSGSKTGSATVTFAGCGSATVDQNGQQQSIQMSYCE